MTLIPAAPGGTTGENNMMTWLELMYLVQRNHVAVVGYFDTKSEAETVARCHGRVTKVVELSGAPGAKWVVI